MFLYAPNNLVLVANNEKSWYIDSTLVYQQSQTTLLLQVHSLQFAFTG